MKRLFQLIPFIVMIALLFAGCGSPAQSTAPALSATPAASAAQSTPAGATAQPTEAPSQEATASPEAPAQEVLDVGIGGVAALNGVALQVTKIEKSDGSDVDVPGQGKEYAVVTVYIKNIGDAIMSYSPYYFKMRDGAGQETDTALVLLNAETALVTGELLPGGLISGTVVFEVPKGDARLSFIYQDAVLSESKRITVDLSSAGGEAQPMTQGQIKAGDIQSVKAGEENKLGSAAVTLNKVTRSSGDEYTTPRPGMEYIIVEITVKNTGAENLTYGPFDFKMRNSLGQQNDFTLVSFLNDNALSSSELAPGAAVTGEIAFEVPAGDAGLMLVYQQLSLEKTDYIGFEVK